MPRIFGIDLGTTYSCIAYADDAGKPVVLRNSRSQATTPSVVLFEGENVVVGQTAKELAEGDPSAVTQMFKREMCNEEWSFSCQGKTYRPEELSSFVLRKLVEDVSQQLGEPITDVVITCPAWFGSNQREATANAGKIAGLNVREIINEPTAAAISYGLHTAQDEIVLVYDLGGGTFDITMIDIKKNKIEVICTGGNHYLGGKNWDAQLVRYLAEKFCEAKGGNPDDLLDNLETRQDLYSKAEASKQRLGNKDSDKVIVNHDGEKSAVEITRAKFDEITRSLLENTIVLTKEMLEEAKKKGYSKFDKLLLVGGSTLMPQVSERLKQEFNVECKIHDPHESVAKGAAMYGRLLEIGQQIQTVLINQGTDQKAIETGNVSETEKRKAAEEVARKTGLSIAAVQAAAATEIINVTSRSYGIVIQSPDDPRKEIMSTLIKRNDKVPGKVSKTYGTAEAGQDGILFRLVESLSTDDSIPMDQTEEVKNEEMCLPPGMPKGTPVEVTFSITKEGKLEVFAKELITGRELKFEVQVSKGMTPEQVAEAKSNCKAMTVQQG